MRGKGKERKEWKKGFEPLALRATQKLVDRGIPWVKTYYYDEKGGGQEATGSEFKTVEKTRDRKEKFGKKKIHKMVSRLRNETI